MLAVNPEDRIDSIDAIRGIALFGVLTVNLVTEFRVSLFQQFLPSAATGADLFVENAVSLVLEQKAFSLFALLFGVGLGIQYERLSATGRPFYWLARRLAVLLVFGLLHLLFVWNGDILTEYAIAGLVVLPLLRLPNKVLFFAALGFLAVYMVGPRLYSVPWPDAAGLQAHVAAANQVYATGSLAEIFRFSLGELPLFFTLHVWVLPRTLALFVLGMLLWRVGVLRRPREFIYETFGLAVAGIALGVAQPAANAGLAPVFLALGYGAVLLLLAELPGSRSLLAHFAPLGRMAFTNYLLQSLVFCFIFFGYGLGQFGRMSAAAAFALGVAVYVAQIVLSKWWLRRYRFGPVEWLWRTLMYGVAQPMRTNGMEPAGK